MKTDYSELKGKEVNWVYFDGSEILGFVVGAIYRQGITLVRYDDENKYLLCMNYNGGDMPGRKSYRQVFHYIIKQIQNGQINAKDLKQFCSMNELETKRPTRDSCAFR